MEGVKHRSTKHNIKAIGQVGFTFKGIARTLVNKCRNALAREGIRKCNTYVLNSNVEGRNFWEHTGFRLLEYNFRLMQIPTKWDD
jgi:hypothetical protein